MDSLFTRSKSTMNTVPKSILQRCYIPKSRGTRLNIELSGLAFFKLIHQFLIQYLQMEMVTTFELIQPFSIYPGSNLKE